MPKQEKRSFFERLTGSVKIEDGDKNDPAGKEKEMHVEMHNHELPQEEEGQLTVDMWQTPTEIVVQAIVGGVRPDDIDVSISNDMVTIRGKREKSREITGADYFYQELYWGAFSRSIMLPQEVDVDESEATIKGGLLTIRLPKWDKTKTQKLKVKNE
jgi:HSP20 family protein